MRFVFDICLGLVIYFTVIGIKPKTIPVKIGACLMLGLMLVLLPGYTVFSKPQEQWVAALTLDYSLVVVSVILICVIYNRLKDGFIDWDSINRPFVVREMDNTQNQEDFMNTKLGKIMTLMCVILVIYMFVSAFCIYKLNTKINTLYNTIQTNDVNQESAKDK